MKPPVKKEDKVPKETQARIRVSLFILAGVCLVVFMLIATGVVRAETSSTYLVQEYTSSGQVTISVSAATAYYDNVSATAEIVSNGQVVTQANFTGSTELSAYLNQPFTVYVKNGASIVYSKIYPAPSVQTPVLNYEKLGGAVAVMFLAFYIGMRYERTKKSGQKKVPGEHNRSDMDADALAGSQITDIVLDLSREEIEKMGPKLVEKVRNFIDHLSRAAMHSMGATPDDWRNDVLAAKKDIEIVITESSEENAHGDGQ